MPFACIILAVNIGCATYPMGLTRQQWEALPPEEQAAFQVRQYEIDEQRRREQADRQERIRQQQQADAQAQRDRVATLYRDARYGDIVRVTIEGGYLRIYKELYPYHPVAFDLARGEIRDIRFTRSGRIAQSVSMPVRLSEDGNMLFFNDDRIGQVVFPQANWERGHVEWLTTQGGSFGLEGARISIQFKELPGAPQRIILEQR
ncbi:MAG TPA: hypothetical protein PKE26_12400 [Kiritimatiellia bacterium]|nr:hypothetical protein [Kiritimatiellia bacterium]HMO99901.1 hypothetical protein [Kiritimatiellia bacterium]HMP96042.1 hypothetical protein [Kiritimatiellia bacterium]